LSTHIETHIEIAPFVQAVVRTRLQGQLACAIHVITCNSGGLCGRCGPARHATLLAKQWGLRTHALDNSSRMLSFARKQAEAAGADIDFIEADMRDHVLTVSILAQNMHAVLVVCVAHHMVLLRHLFFYAHSLYTATQLLQSSFDSVRKLHANSCNPISVKDIPGKCLISIVLYRGRILSSSTIDLLLSRIMQGDT
jgi:SAM-dependent methyltransferase